MSTLDNVYLEPKSPSIPKRFAAFFIDLVLFVLLFTGVAFIASEVTGYTSTYNQLEEKYIEHGVGYYDAETYEFIFCDVEKEECKKNYEAFYKDEEAMVIYDQLIELTTPILTISVFLAYLVTEFVVPMLFKNGQTVGMYLFKIGMVSNDGTRVQHRQVFIRFLFGKFVVMSMIPIYGIIYSAFSAFGGIFGLLLTLILLGIDLYLTIFGEHKAGIANRIGNCYACDLETSIIYETIEEVNAIKGAQAAERAKKESYF